MMIKHSHGEYPVTFGSMAEALSHIEGDSFVITDANVHEAWGALLPKGVPTHILPPGEETKSLASFERLLRWLANSGAKRRSTVVAFGGGVVGDLAGFVAASYMRGVRFVQVPTTLLAQVDSSVGGKVAVDLPEGKNLVGAFYPPAAVHVAVEALGTLPERQFLNGCGEVWKMGAILDEGLLQRLEREPLRLGAPDLAEVIRRSIELKAQVVEADEHETTGLRAILNFGHTVGHAVEQGLGFREMLHGEAVAVGMVVEARIGERLGVTPEGVASRLEAGLTAQGLPTRIPKGLEPRSLSKAMTRDKKALACGLPFSLLTGVGACKLVTDVNEDLVLDVLDCS